MDGLGQRGRACRRRHAAAAAQGESRGARGGAAQHGRAGEAFRQGAGKFASWGHSRLTDNPADLAGSAAASGAMFVALPWIADALTVSALSMGAPAVAGPIAY